MGWIQDLVRELFDLARRYVLNVVTHGSIPLLRYGSLSIFAIYATAEDFGIVSLLIVFVNFAINGNLGAVNGLKREIPMRLRLLPSRERDRALSSVFTFSIVTSTIITGLLCILFGFIVEHATVSHILMLFAFGCVSSVFFFHQSVLVAFGDLARLRKAQMVLAIALALLSFPAATTGNIEIFISATTLAYASFAVYAAKQFPGITFTRTMSEVGPVVRVGFPIMAAGFMFILFQSIDRLVLSKYLGAAALGSYTFAWMIVNSLNLLLSFGGEIVFQKGSYNFGLDKDKNSLFRFLGKYLLYVTGVLAIIGVPMLLGIDFVIDSFFPQYVGAGDLVRIIFVAFLVQQVFQAFGHYFPIVNRQGMYLSTIAVAVCLSVALFVVIVEFHGGVYHFALGTMVANMILAGLVVGVMVRDIGRARAFPTSS